MDLYWISRPLWMGAIAEISICVVGDKINQGELHHHLPMFIYVPGGILTLTLILWISLKARYQGMQRKASKNITYNLYNSRIWIKHDSSLERTLKKNQSICRPRFPVTCSAIIEKFGYSEILSNTIVFYMSLPRVGVPMHVKMSIYLKIV